MLKKLSLYILFFLLSVLIGFKFQNQVHNILLIPQGIFKVFFKESRIEPNIKIENFSNDQISIFANSFELVTKNLKNFSGFTKDENNVENPQHKSAALYASKINGETYIELFTRDGHIINNESIEKLELPNFYDPHNTQGGIRGVFFIDDEIYIFMASKKIGCQNVSIFNIDRKKKY